MSVVQVVDHIEANALYRLPIGIELRRPSGEAFWVLRHDGPLAARQPSGFARAGRDYGFVVRAKRGVLSTGDDWWTFTLKEGSSVVGRMRRFSPPNAEAPVLLRNEKGRFVRTLRLHQLERVVWPDPDADDPFLESDEDS